MHAGMLNSISMSFINSLCHIIQNAVTRKPTPWCAGNVVAYAAFCDKEKEAGRPVSGGVNFCEQYLNPTANFQEQVATAIHEITHALVFDPVLFQDFRYDDGEIPFPNPEPKASLRCVGVLVVWESATLASSRLGSFGVCDVNVVCRISEGRTGDKSEEMKAWVSSTLGDSLKLITKKLEEVDAKAEVTAAEKEELARLQMEKVALEKVVLNRGKETSSEKRKRAMAAPVALAVAAAAVTPKTIVAKTRSRGSSKSRTRRVEISSDDECEVDGVRENLALKMEKSSDLSEVKKLLSELVQGLADQKGKQRAMTPETGREPEPEPEDPEDIDLAQKFQSEEAEADEDGLAAYMKMRQDFYMSLHFSRVQELCKQKGVHYVRKDTGSWEVACVDLQEYVDQLKNVASKITVEPSRNQDNADLSDAAD
ncbi:hypothetical protein CBR_g37158 [Chara braunii]|uniref:Uncharacterized protein n=1 Tax=Chara braunii TaxID=69332 RepID=A0A388LM84_CHABU|nr:hypothetical protein CBR_g37158 [Chara braunii]|eukprot:GBG83446.1 hypothetical protein CBR_g37158 [Chara braunii]